MTRFHASNQSSATLKSSRVEVWKALTDPELLPELTPYLHRIDVDGDRHQITSSSSALSWAAV